MFSLNNNWQYVAMIISVGIVQPIIAATLIGYNGSMDSSPSVALDNATQLLTVTWFNISKPSVIYAHGFKENFNNDTVTNISSALYDVEGSNKNILILNWKDEASDGGLGRELGYSLHAVPGAKSVGTKLAEKIVELIDNGLNEDIHVIGHSLGAQLCGIMGREAEKLGHKISRLTGLDPAGPIFDADLTETIRIDDSDGAFVDIYHTNAGGLGTSSAIGTADVWFNYNSTLSALLAEQRQPACDNVSEQQLCSHQLSVYYFTESIRTLNGTDNAFIAASAKSYSAWKAGQTNGTTVVGYYIDTGAKGNYYLTTNASKPYAKAEDGATAN